MSDTDIPEVEASDLGDIEVYEPHAIGCADLEGLIFDPLEFSELTNSIAMVMRNGQMFVLDRDTLSWRCVEPERKKSALKIVKDK